MDLDILHAADELLHLVVEQLEILELVFPDEQRDYIRQQIVHTLEGLAALPEHERYAQPIVWSVTKKIKGKDREFGLSYPAIWAIRPWST